MTRYLIYRSINYSNSLRHPMEALAILNSEWCVISYSGEIEPYESGSEVGELNAGTNSLDYEIIVDTTSLEEFLESEHLAEVDVRIVNGIKRACL